MRLHTEYKMKLWSAVFLALGLIGCQQNSPSVNGYAVINREGESFYIDQTEVTIGAFRDFILQTGYVTTSDSLGWSGVFATNQGGWIPVTQANWEKPLGQEIGADELPVTHVSYFDAVAFCSWKNGRLPSADEWDAAAGEKNHSR
jgi:formylglycine-generating enzyme required for sulfatase activity